MKICLAPKMTLLHRPTWSSPLKSKSSSCEKLLRNNHQSGSSNNNNTLTDKQPEPRGPKNRRERADLAWARERSPRQRRSSLHHPHKCEECQTNGMTGTVFSYISNNLLHDPLSKWINQPCSQHRHASKQRRLQHGLRSRYGLVKRLSRNRQKKPSAMRLHDTRFDSDRHASLYTQGSTMFEAYGRR